MAMTCTRAAGLSLAAVGGHATEAERLELEAHLATCARCSDEHGALATVRRLREVEPDELSATARERVRRAVLAAPALAAAPACSRLRWPIAAGVALAAAAAAAFWVRAEREDSPRILAGDVVVAAARDGAAGGVDIRSGGSGDVQLDGARVALARATEIVWRRESRSVDLRAGTVIIDVEHRAGRRFEVRTPAFRVEVVGTRFAVDLGGVRTERGLVRVLALDGTVVASVAAGQSWSAAAPASAAAIAGPPAGELPPAAGAPVEAPAPGAAEETTAARLARARRALARGDAAEARRAVEPAFHLGRDVAAEARALYAESFLVEGRYTDAVDGYEVVIRDFPSTPQAESALYAVAQLESEHGRVAEARATLERYLARYPQGRFAREAEGRLARLAPPER
jgi:ferric-dicitrate binding protein FerR (iron transport regulator)